MKLSLSPAKLIRVLATLVIVVIAVIIGRALWLHYMYDPWTRDGRINADVIEIAPDVSGLVTAVEVHDNQPVQRGQLLLTIDNSRYRNALASARAAQMLAKVTAAQARRELKRRLHLSGAVVSSEDLEIARAKAQAAAARLASAQTALSLAELNLRRTRVLAPSDGYITHLRVFAGDYAHTGRALMALIDSHSFRVDGYFEETKLRHIHVGDAARIQLLGGGPTLQGHVQSIARGITDQNNVSGSEMLANVSPTFSWVRLAQRVPVRIHIDKIPQGITLVSGTTCTVTLLPHRKQHNKNAPPNRGASPP